jgi:hypothetical protein
VVDLLEHKHRSGMRFDPVEVIESGSRVAVRTAWEGYKVFTFEGDRAVLLRDCVDRDDALAQLAAD